MISLLICFSSTDTYQGCSLPNGQSTGSCCTADNPCYVDEGDCDNDSDCMAGLYCGNSNCPEGFPSGHDCCSTSKSGCDVRTYEREGCTSAYCSLQNGHSTGGCCTTDNPCNVNEGDCDYDYECMHGLSCGESNCPSGFPSDHDCCTGTKNVFELAVQLDVNALEAMVYHAVGGDDSNKISTEVDNAIRISSTVNGNLDYNHTFSITPGTSNNFVIKQYLKSSGYYYEIVVDGVSKLVVQNTMPELSSFVGLYSNSYFTTTDQGFGELSSFSAGML